MTPKEVFEKLKARFGDKLETFLEVPVEPCLSIRREGLLDVSKALRDDLEFRFDLLVDIAGVDYGDKIASVVHLLSSVHKHRLVLRVDVPRADAVVPSLVGLWPAAGWHERETWDLMGIKYEGHPDLRRILCPDEWEGHPLRKDYVFPKEFQGITLE
ncbi:MAG: NADH-quinone oxidoreductase subunit C [Planctomycetes bacterium]|nr:NADH-quinone oxidoreductase subunit C [Planctomycetota bacterium]